MSHLHRSATLPLPGDLASSPLQEERANPHERPFAFQERGTPHGRIVTDGDEALIADSRGALSPAQMVERKLSLLLRGRLLPISHARLRALPQKRGKA